MREFKDGVRSLVRIGYDGSVHKTFRGADADQRFANEIRVLRHLEAKGCPNVPQVLEAHEDELRLVTTNCGKPVERLSDEKAASLFAELEKTYGVRHDDPFLRNITYSPQLGSFCVIDFELAEIVGEKEGEGYSPSKQEPRWTFTNEGPSDSARRGQGPAEAGAPSPAKDHDFVLRWCGRTRKGANKSENEDSLIVFSADTGGTVPLELDGEGNLSKSGYVLAVSDGLGGHAAGAFASSLVVSKLAKNLAGRVGHLRGTAQPLSVLLASVEEAHHAINRLAAGKPEIDGMAATLVCGWFWEQHLHFVHIGDSRIYRWREGTLTQLTNDHTRVGRMFRDGKLNERQVRSHPMNHVLQQVIGGQHQVVNPQVATLRTMPGDRYLLCSDGITDGLWNKHLEEIFSEAEAHGQSSEELADILLERACSSAGRDDTTLLMVTLSGRM